MINFGNSMGLLSQEEDSKLNNNAMLQASLALMGASGPSTKPNNLGAVLSQGLQTGQQAYNSGLESTLGKQQMLEQRQMKDQRKQVLGELNTQGGIPPKEKILMGIQAAIQMQDMELAKQLKGMLDAYYPAQDETTDIKNYKQAVQQGYQGTFNDWLTNVKRAGATTVTNNINSNPERAFDKKVAEQDATTFSTLLENGYKAKQNIATADQLGQVLSKSGSGFGAAVTAYAGNFGLDIGKEGQLGDLQAAQALINKLVPQQRPPGSGTMSDADLALFKASLPRLINTPEGNRKIIETIKKINQYDVEVAKIAAQARSGAIPRTVATQQIMSIPNPLADFKNSVESRSDEDIFKQYGIQ